jgi:hypothetical protein
MTTHTLHESRDVEITFFMGKSPKFTFRSELALRLQQHIQLASNTHIPVSVKNNYATCENVKSEVVTLFVGKKDATTVIDILQQRPFTECEMVMKSLRRGNPAEWKNKLDIHSALVDHSQAIKIYLAPETIKTKLNQLVQGHKPALEKVIDIARVGFAGAKEVLYVQCHGAHKSWLTDWLRTKLIEIHPEEKGRPYIQDENQHNNNSGRTGRPANTKIEAEPPRHDLTTSYRTMPSEMTLP